MLAILNLARAYATPILISLTVAGLLLLFRFVYGLGYDACEQEVAQAVNDSLVEDKKEADNVRIKEQNIKSNELDSALLRLGILRD